MDMLYVDGGHDLKRVLLWESGFKTSKNLGAHVLQ